MGDNIKGLKPNPKSKYKQGYYTGAKKYIGPEPIIYRSSLEYKYIIKLETSPDVEKWSSENIQIPYVMQEHCSDGKFREKRHVYNIDFTVWMKDGRKYIVEVKPFSLSPLNESQIKRSPVVYKNACKWRAAIQWAKTHGFEFKVITEKSFIK